jgi:TolA-binding protein
MNFRTRRVNPSSWTTVLVLVSALAAAAAYAAAPSAGSGAAPAQDMIRVESRLTQLEQRFYQLETNIRGLEQQLRLSDIANRRPAGDPEAGQLRSELEALRRRLAEVECGLARVDERTLPAAAREARRKSGAAAGDPCRLNADAPLSKRVNSPHE